MFYVGIAVLAAMFMLAGVLWLVSEGIRDRKRARNQDRYYDLIQRNRAYFAQFQPKDTSAEWATIMRPPAPGRDPSPATVQFRALTDTGAMRALKTETDTFLADLLREPGETS